MGRYNQRTELTREALYAEGSTGQDRYCFNR
jgi:hypothetical protein